MEIKGSFRIPAPMQRVWDGLNDPEILRQCIPGCEALTRQGDNQFAGKVVAKVGPVKATFSGQVTLADLDPPRGYTLVGEGKGGVAGFAKGSAKVSLHEEGAETVLDYLADASVGGKLAQLGGRLIEATVAKTADDFFAKFGALVGGTASAPSVSLEAELAPDAAMTAAATGTPMAAAIAEPPIAPRQRDFRWVIPVGIAAVAAAWVLWKLTQVE